MSTTIAPDLGDIQKINELLKAGNLSIKAAEAAGVKAASFYKENEYLRDPIRRLMLKFSADELLEIKSICEKHGIKNLAKFLLEELRKG